MKHSSSEAVFFPTTHKIIHGIFNVAVELCVFFCLFLLFCGNAVDGDGDGDDVCWRMCFLFKKYRQQQINTQPKIDNKKKTHQTNTHCTANGRCITHYLHYLLMINNATHAAE